MNASRRARTAAREAERSPAFKAVARAGFAANGLVHLLIGGIAVRIALGGGGSADQSGALGAVAATPGGTVVLWIVALALIGLALWQIVQGVAVREKSIVTRWAQRLREASKGIAFGIIGVTSLIFAVGGDVDSSQASQAVSRWLISTPGGVFVVALIGVIVGAVGCAFVWRGASRNFEDEIVVRHDAGGHAVIVVGIVGYVSKGIALVTLGVLFVIAAITTDPDTSGSLDEALKALATLPYGQVVLMIVAVGVIAFGVYSLARSRMAQLR